MMVTQIDPLQVRAILGRKNWGPPRIWGPDGWQFVRLEGATEVAKIIVSQFTMPPPEEPVPYDATEWIHASYSLADRTPTWDELQVLKRAVWGDTGEAYQVHPPASDHVNIHPYVSHLWGRADGKRVLPNFGFAGTI